MGRENVACIHSRVYSAIKDETMPCAEKWMTLEIMISQRSQDNKYHNVCHMKKLDLKEKDIKGGGGFGKKKEIAGEERKRKRG